MNSVSDSGSVARVGMVQRSKFETANTIILILLLLWSQAFKLEMWTTTTTNNWKYCG